MGAAKAQLAEALAEPDGPGVFLKGRRGDRKELKLPAAKLQFVEMEPTERAVNRPVGRELEDAPLLRAVHGHASPPRGTGCPSRLDREGWEVSAAA